WTPAKDSSLLQVISEVIPGKTRAEFAADECLHLTVCSAKGVIQRRIRGRRTGRRRDGAHRRSLTRRHGSLRTGHPLLPREWLCSQRGACQRAGGAFPRGTWFRFNRPRVPAKSAVLLP